MATFQQEIGEWGNHTFPGGTPDSIVAHLRKEVEELAENHAPEEAADCLILLLHHAHRCGYDLMIEAFKKFDINKTRKWGLPDKDGVVEHIKNEKEIRMSESLRNRERGEKTVIKKDAMEIYQLKHDHGTLKERVTTFRKRLMTFCDTLDEPLPEYTGWFVLLKKNGEGWEFLGFYNPNISEEEDAEPGWTVALPIPKPETVEEFQGW